MRFPKYPLLKLPLDENQQYVKSFTIDQQKEYTEVFNLNNTLIKIVFQNLWICLYQRYFK